MQQYKAIVTDPHNNMCIVLEPRYPLEEIIIDADCKEIAEEISKIFSNENGATYRIKSSKNSYVVLGPNGPVFEVMSFNKKPPIYVRPHDEISNEDDSFLSKIIANQYAGRFNQPTSIKLNFSISLN